MNARRTPAAENVPPAGTEERPSPPRRSAAAMTRSKEIDARVARFEGSARWREILDVAADHFADKGYEATSVQDIADAVGMLKGSLYHYISEKEDLLFHVLIEIHDQLLVRFEEYANVGDGSLAKIRAFIDGHTRVNIVEIRRGSIFYLNFPALSEARQKLILERRRQFDTFLRATIEEGKREGSIRADVDANLAALAILTSLNSLYIWYNPARGDGSDHIAAEFAELFVSGLAAKGVGEPSITAIAAKPTSKAPARRRATQEVPTTTKRAKR
jgi:AcrR family transcriptional regulator